MLLYNKQPPLGKSHRLSLRGGAALPLNSEDEKPTLGAIARSFLETALVKLYLKLSKRGVRPTLNELILPADRLETSQLRILSDDRSDASPTAAEDLIQLISSLVHIDVDDLVIFLQQAQAHHALALIYQWQGNLAAALDVWQRLAYNELQDDYFPGVPFYLAVIRSLTCPDATNHAEYETHPLPNSVTSETVDHSVPSVYADLVWKHLCCALDSGKLDLSEQILSGIPVPSLSDGWSSLTSASITHQNLSSTVAAPSEEALKSDRILAPSQLLTPASILGRISHPELARKYLRQLIYHHGDCDSNHHTRLGELYVDRIRNAVEHKETSDSDKVNGRQLRREFCHFLRHSEHYSVEHLLTRIRERGSQNFPLETAILLGKSGQHKTALNILITELDDIPAAVCYCLSFSKPSKDACQWTLPDSAQTPEEAFTALVELCIQSTHASHNQFALELINTMDIPLNFVRILRALPSQISLSHVQPFLARAFRTVQHQLSTCHLTQGLAKRQAIVAAETLQSGLDAAPLPQLVRTGEEQCAACHRNLTLYGSTSAFAWSTRSNQCFHIHCWEQSHRAA
ncbi:unnamed protein product [Echinostoma caproni]|uniref:Vps39_2 domain-containing protein n=1 Tax=Echinostoma caproni TaxID=27848 RepID=A0A183A9A6_9TREM|nr:unnamed protein product [Echinostoma caproni]